MASRGWGPWSDWAVDTEGRRYRVRYDAYGMRRIFPDSQ